jgi:hypothetical protein
VVFAAALNKIMHLHEELLSLGFSWGDARLDLVVSFLEQEEFESVDDLAGAPSVYSFAGASQLATEELVFLQKACVLRSLGGECCVCVCSHRLLPHKRRRTIAT